MGQKMQQRDQLWGGNGENIGLYIRKWKGWGQKHKRGKYSSDNRIEFEMFKTRYKS